MTISFIREKSFLTKFSSYLEASKSYFIQKYSSLNAALKVYLWQGISCKETADALYIANEVLWNNRHVTPDGNSLYDKSLIDKGSLTIRDISNEVGELLSWSEAEQKVSLNRVQFLNWLGLLLYPKSLEK